MASENSVSTQFFEPALIRSSDGDKWQFVFCSLGWCAQTPTYPRAVMWHKISSSSQECIIHQTHVTLPCCAILYAGTFNCDCFFMYQSWIPSEPSPHYSTLFPTRKKLHTTTCQKISPSCHWQRMHAFLMSIECTNLLIASCFQSGTFNKAHSVK